MIELLKKYGMVALAVALAVWAICGGADARRLGRTCFKIARLNRSFGLLILGGLIAMHRGLRGGRAAVAVGALLTGLLALCGS